MKDKERCDDASEVFNARVCENEMIIKIAEYEEMKKIIKNAQKREEINIEIRNKIREENKKLKAELENITYENRKIKKGIINFVKVLGG